MKMTARAGSISVGDKEHEEAYGIEFNPFMASLLSDKLYTDKPYACWRELYANAHDESDNIQVQIPTRNDPVCRIWDNGVGLNKDELIGLFCTYGASNKRDTNSKIGGFGVGSKVLFSYTDTFSAFSVKDGVRTDIICYKNDEGMPTARILGHKKSNEQSGTSIEWAISEWDTHKFREAALDVFSRFEHKPRFMNGFEHAWVERMYDLEGDGWAVRTSQFSSTLPRTGSGAHIVLGGIAYPIEANPLGGSRDFRALVDSNVDIFAPIGSVALAASREALSYEPKTVSYLTNRLRSMKEEAIKKIEQKTASARNWYERAFLRSELASSISFLPPNYKFAQDEERPPSKEFQAKEWDIRTTRKDYPTKLRFVTVFHRIVPYKWEQTRRATLSEWATAVPDDVDGPMYYKKRVSHDAVISFPKNKTPPGFYSRISNFAKHYGMKSIIIISEAELKWAIDSGVPVDHVIMWNSEVHAKWHIPAVSSARSERKEFQDVSVHKVTNGLRWEPHLSLNPWGRMGSFPEDDDQPKWFILLNGKKYDPEENPGMSGNELKVGHLCAAGLLDVYAIPKTYARVLRHPYLNVNKNKKEFETEVRKILRANSNVLLDGYVRSVLHDKFKEFLQAEYRNSLCQCAELLSVNKDWDPPKWATRFLDILRMDYHIHQSGHALKPLVGEKAGPIIEREYESTLARLAKKPLFLAVLKGLPHGATPASSIVSLSKYVRA